MKDYYIVIPGSSWGGQTATFGPMDEEEAQTRLEVYLPLYMPECPPKLLRVVRDYASDPAPAVTAAAGDDAEGDHIVHHVRDPKGDEAAHG